jgi:Dual-action HEIGH metallo-peptidase
MMKKVLFGAISCAFLSGLVGCQKDNADIQEEKVPDSVISQLRSMGFGTDNVQRTEGGFLVEGDIIVTPEMLAGNGQHQKLRIAEVEQYRTFNLVTGLPRVIRIGTSGTIPAGLSTAINNAIARYNAEGLGITFLRVTSSPTITIRIVNTGQYIASAGFPSNGNPFNTVNYAKKYSTGYSDGFMTTVLAHEIGHCIGFRHTDYMNRAYSCGSGGNEGQETTGVGAVLIPGTPSGPDAASWMLACLGATTNRPFNANDKVALNFLY